MISGAEELRSITKRADFSMALALAPNEAKGTGTSQPKFSFATSSFNRAKKMQVD